MFPSRPLSPIGGMVSTSAPSTCPPPRRGRVRVGVHASRLPPILTFPRKGGKGLYLRLSAHQGGRGTGTVRQAWDE